MISFRYHLVSIVAVFAALTIGIVAGSTVVKNLVLDATEQNLQRTEAQVEAANRDNAALSDRLDRAGRLTDELPEVFLTGLLAGAPVLVIEAPEVEDDTRDGVIDALDIAGAEVVGRVTLRPVVADSTEILRLADVLEVDSSDPDTVRGLLGQRIGAQVLLLSDAVDEAVAATSRPPPTSVPASTSSTPSPSEPGAGSSGLPSASNPIGSSTTTLAPTESTTTTEVPSTTTTEFVAAVVPTDLPDDDSLGGFEDAGLLELDVLASSLDPISSLTVVVIGQQSSGQDVVAVIDGLLAELLGAETPVQVVVAEATDYAEDDETVAPSLVGAVRDNPEWRRSMSTVDTLDDDRGRIALVLAIAEIDRGGIGHYGDRAGGERLLPLPA